MLQRKLDIAIDFDDVLFDMTPSLIEYVNAHYGTAVTYEEHFSFFLEDVWSVSIEEAKRRVDEFVRSDRHGQVPPVPDAIAVTRRLQQKHRLHLVTGRCLTHKPQAMSFLDIHFAETFETYNFTNFFSDVHKDKAITKAELCQNKGMHVLIEDAPVHALDVAKLGIPVLLYDRPWNKDLAHDHITRVRNWLEIEREIHKLCEAPP
jgi:uncharacterized HAD superfamily protein